MPKVKQSPLVESGQIFERNVRMRGYYMGYKSNCQIAKRAGIAISTFNLHMHSPSYWTLGQISAIASALNTSVIWLLTDHSKEGVSI